MLPVKTAEGVIAWFLKSQGHWAITLPNGIYVLPGREYPWLIRHERKHEEQMRRLGVARFLIAYLYYQARYGYEDNPFEQEARLAEREQGKENGGANVAQ